jgi:hypothetical protein
MTAAAVNYGQDSPPLLSVSGLAVQFGALRALDGVDLTVRPGELARRQRGGRGWLPPGIAVVADWLPRMRAPGSV